MTKINEQQLAEKIHQALIEYQANPPKVKVPRTEEGQITDPWFDISYYHLCHFTGVEVNENFIRNLTELLADKGVVVKNDTDAELLNFTFSKNSQ